MSKGPVHAAGVVPYRVRSGALQVALVHRPRCDDWSWPKGKLDRGEDWTVAAVRETLEETGLVVRVGVPLPGSSYPLRSGQEKIVRYWAGPVIEEPHELTHEVDEIAWLSPTLAERRLTYERDREQLAALSSLHRRGRLDTWPLLVVRHAQALDRKRWKRPDPERPLSAVGRRWAQRMVPIIQAYSPEMILTSPSTRCTQTLVPHTAAGGVSPKEKKGLSEETFEVDPTKLDKHLARLYAEALPSAICTHGPLFPPLLQDLWERSASQLPAEKRRELARMVDTKPDKGEVLACTMHGRGEHAVVVDIERHRPPVSSR